MTHEFLVFVYHMRILCWNVNGIRAAQRKGFLDYIKKEKPDVLCLQETKAQPDQLDPELLNVKGYQSHFVSAEKKGYSGVAMYLKNAPESIQSGCGSQRFDCEGRVIAAHYPEFVLYNIY